ncbi:MAG: ABC transporter permease [Acidobacteriia bacterium]|nr:ABC transporter permease [Terriglobia bacterium]
MWRWKKRDQDLEREIRAHMELEEEEQRNAGVTPDEAPYAARRAFGNVTLFKEVTREMWGWTSLERLGQDLRYAVRMMKNSPGFTLVAVLSLALGIGGNTAIFSLMNAVMLRSLPVQEPDRLVLFGAGRAVGITDSLPDKSWQLFAYPFYREVQRKNQVFSGVTAMMSLPNDVRTVVQGARASEPVHTRLVSGTYFSVLGVTPVAGRTFTDAEDQTPGANPVAVMSHSWWQRRFGRDPSVVGKTLTIGSTVYKIIGVTPPEFFGTTVGESPDLWIPLAMNGQVPPGWGGEKATRDPSFQSLYILARLRPGVGAAQAGSQVNLIFKQSLHQRVGSHPSEEELRGIRRALIEITPGGRGLSEIRQQFSMSLRLLMAAVSLVLLIACANIANLLLARAASRQKEIAVRLSIGASRLRLIRQMLTESVLLAVLGGVVGVAFAGWAGQFLVWMVSTGAEPLPLRVAPDAPVLIFTTLLAVATGILFGLAPALRATRVELSSSLKEGRSSVSARSRNMLARALIVSQVALSAVLLIGAGLFVRSLVNLRNVDTGFNKENVLLVGVDVPSLGYEGDDPRLTSLYRQVEQRVNNVPGVRSTSFSFFTFQEGAWTMVAHPQGRTPPVNQPEVHNNVVGPGFFATMGLPITLGRGFGLNDTATSPKVAVINETMARRYFPGGSPIGLHFGFSQEHSGDFEVVGVVKDAKYESLRERPTPMAFYPYAQRVQYLGELSVRYAGDPHAIVPAIRRAFAEVNGNLPITGVRTLAEQVDNALVGEKLIARLSSFFGLLALLLASIGIYGVLSYAVARRTSELGLRMALGAPRSNVVWLVMRDVLPLVTIGLAIGVPAAVSLERLASGLFYGLSDIDPLSIAAGIGILAVVAGVAAYLPARRASLVDPSTALRYE